MLGPQVAPDVQGVVVDLGQGIARRVSGARLLIGLKDVGVDDAAVVEPEAAPQNGLAIAEYIPGEPDARGDIVAIVGMLVGLCENGATLPLGGLGAIGGGTYSYS